MPTNTLTASFSASSEVTLDNAEEVIFAPSSTVTVGDDSWGSISISFEDGSGNQQANEAFAGQITIAAGANHDVDLKNFTNILGQTASHFTAVKEVICSIVSADGTKTIRLGPQNVSNGFQGWFGGVAATDYETIVDTVARVNSWSGWAVGASTKVLRLHNPGAASVTVNLLIVGVK